jgi:uncharacterized protein YjbJ (UPF0337 family)
MSEYSPRRRHDGHSRERPNPQWSAELSEEAKEKARKVTQHVKEGAAEVVDDAREQVRSFVDEQKATLAEQLGALGDAIQQSASCLRERHVGSIASLTEQAADNVAQLSRTIREQDYRGMLESVQDWARRRPVLFLGGCVLGGILVARFMKSSRKPRQGSSLRARHHRLRWEEP